MASQAKCRIMAACIRRPLSAKAISHLTGLPLASTYRQVKSLVGDGILAVERSAMTEDGKPYDLYRSQVMQARLDITPDRVNTTWKPNASAGSYM